MYDSDDDNPDKAKKKKMSLKKITENQQKIHMKYINRNQVERMQRDNLNLKTQFSNLVYSLKQKGKSMSVIDRVQSYIIKNEDELFEH